ncbi:hypothetical protein DL990_13665 [Amycolatopsis sp. WAC 01416]|uniref:hypothetical protein n=1 Tax=Amycolatopsis sp. WAC 01416 TaxID=2203196 RepID=UPI000F76B63F|nr:hypothetical protein [Amycolatopsis sp. WAC 01416]RSN34678.1 hypothetical protein DL990_13665 [Amycolatopsis sp. WAC 01416]
MRARHAPLLAAMLSGRMESAVPNWFSIISPAGTREQLVRQSRSDDHLCPAPDSLPPALAGSHWQMLAVGVRNWPQQDPNRQVLLVQLLTQLGFHDTVAELVPRVTVRAGDPTGQQLAFEVARSGRLLDRKSKAPLRVFDWLTEHADHPSLRVSSAIQLASALTRAHRDHSTAISWIYRADQESTQLGIGPDWLWHLLRSRRHRVAALIAARGGDHGRSAEEMRSALDHDDRLADLAHDRFTRHYQRENRALVIEAFLKLDTITGRDSAPAGIVESATRVDAYDPDLRFTAGSYLAGRERWDQALVAFLAAADSGTIRGAVGAFRAGLCLQRLRRPEAARRAYRLCLDLDPVSISAAERLSAGATS